MRRLALALVTAALVATATPATAQSSLASLVLESQTAWVGNGGRFVLRIAPPRAPRVAPVDLEYAVSVHRASPTRNEFAQTLTNRATSAPIAVVTTAFSDAVTDETGAVTLEVGIQDPALPRDSDRIGLRRAGVYPVAVDLRTVGGTVHARLLTHLIFVPTPPTGPRLAVGLVVPVRAPVALQPNGEDRLAARDVAAITAVAQTLARLPAQGVLLAPSPETLAALLRNAGGGAAALQALRSIAPTHTVIGAPFVPTRAAVAPQSHRAASAERGRGIVGAAFGSSSFTDLVIVDDVADDRIIDTLPDRLIVRDTTLQPASSRITTAEPILVRRAGSRVTAPALLADPGISAHLRNRASPVLAAHHLLADLATVYFDSPGRFRSIVVLPTETWRADAAVLGPLIAGLSSSPILEAASVDRLYTKATPRTVPPTRTFLAAPSASNAPDNLASVRRTIDSLRSVMTDAPAVLQSFDDRLFIAESTLLSSAARRRYVSELSAALAEERRKFQLPTGGSLTLTARRGAIPITVRSSAEYPARVLLEVASDRLTFPGGSTRLIKLSRHDTTERFTVQSLGSGAFPLRVLLKSPDGKVLLGQSRLTVRSTDVSGVGIGLSVGAGVFLLVWWYRHSVRRRRARAA